MTTLTDKELIKEIKERIGSLDIRDNIERRAYEIALASLEAEPVAYIFKHPAGKLFWALTDESNKEQPDVIPVYADSPAPVVPDEIDVNDVPRAVTYFKTHRDCYADGWNACRAAMLQSGNFRENKNSSTNNFREIAETSTNYPVIPDGLSTVCAEAYQVVGVMADALGVFGDAAVQKVLDNLSQQKLVHRDVLPFSLPVTPDGWISCSDRMPNDAQWCVVNTEYGYYVQCWSEGQGWLGDDISIPKCDVINWMPLPEPPQG
ncbi:TPA: DUF551 domain-containing protein [Escherichia coli]|uniref:DUF551 domain-containing protein n=1 Tax=Escherichia sp. 7785 TaxID=2822430 RepID=UPI001992E4BE|nr:DUF551 domain-containing protein [Escherichia sp. 7785]EEV6626849.1 DUF551 domain-containing protein [Escherichia coli]EJE4010970.1 DUF551 domain-containing protein [Escherichia coli]HAL0716666.1 DUF551 domain-containing protein [Escherichia coli]HCT2484065.1 DUF551 domain-containing protein [Escherichia coli]